MLTTDGLRPQISNDQTYDIGLITFWDNNIDTYGRPYSDSVSQ